jgi:hypothetical protein
VIELRRDAKLGALLTLVVAASGASMAHVIVGCNDAALIEPAACTPGHCTCAEDPAQSTCGGFVNRAVDATVPADANSSDATTSADGSVDAEGDASNDGPDAAD